MKLCTFQPKLEKKKIHPDKISQEKAFLILQETKIPKNILSKKSLKKEALKNLLYFRK